MTKTALEKYWAVMKERHAKEKLACMINAQELQVEASSEAFQGAVRHINDPFLTEADDLPLLVKDLIVVLKHLMKRIEILEGS